MKTYDPKKVTAIWGPVIFTGFVDDSDAMTLAYDEDHASKKVGLDGQVARSMNPNRTGKFTARLMQTSMTNDLLSAMAQQDMADRSAVYPLVIKDLAGLTTGFAKEAWIMKMPDMARAKEIGVNEWVLDCGQVDLFQGGVAG